MSKKQQKKSTNWALWGGILVFIALIAGSFMYKSFQEKRSSAELAPFAQCLTDQKAVFYGAFWCPHCQRQKEIFGDSQKLLSYVECSTPDGRGQLPVCQEKNIAGYPTWIFGDDSRASGELTLETLSRKTGCALP